MIFREPLSRLRSAFTTSREDHQHFDCLRGPLRHLTAWFERAHVEYIKLAWSNKAVRSGTIKSLIIHQLSNLHFLAQLMIQVYLVDEVLVDVQKDAANRVHFLGLNGYEVTLLLGLLY